MKTKRSALVLLFGCLLLSGLMTATATAKEPWEKIKIPALNAFQMPAYERVELPNGMVLYLAEDHTLPLIELSATIRVGSLYDPADKLGLASMTGSVLRTGGAGERTGDDIDALVESRGLVVESYAGTGTGGAYVSCLDEDLDLGLALLADMLMRPRFAEDKIELAKQEQKASISRRNDETMSIAMREAPKALYGADHPLARYPEYDTVAAVTRDDMVAFHADYYGPDRTYLVAIGDFDTAAMKARIAQAFADWAPARKPLPADPEVPWHGRTVNVASKDGLTQAIVLLGHRGIRNDHPDYAALSVAAEILGGGFNSRLFKEIRSNQGLAYAVGAAPGTGWRFPGMFMAYTMTKNETVEEAAKGILAEIDRMLREPVSAAELQFAKDLILNSEVFDYDSKREVMDRLVTLEMYGYQPDFLQAYQAAVKALTPADILAAVQAAWKPEDLTFMVVGTPSEFDGDLSTFGTVNQIDITIPAPTPQLVIPAATPESLARGMELMKNLRDQTGGKAYAGIKSLHEVSEMTVQSPMGPLAITLDSTVQLPDRLRMVTKLPFGEQVMVVKGNQGWAKGMGQSQDLDAAQAQELLAQFTSDTKFLLGRLQDHEFQALEPMEIAGKTCNPVAFRKGDETTIYFLDAENGLLVMTQEPAVNQMTGSPVTQKAYVKAYGELGGIKLPVAVTITQDDEDFAEVVVKTFERNPTVDAALFEK
ncbi:MAG: pitrilysin family protein [Candidatus Krumholzibacteriia bacterium]